MDSDSPQTPPRPGFGERLRLSRNKRYEELAHILFGGPVGAYLTALVTDISWITPNLLTIACFLARVAACWLLIEQTSAADITAVILIVVAIPVDVMDGSLARYRKMASSFGAYLDKVSDTIAMILFIAALSHRLWLESSDVTLVALTVYIGMTLLFRRYLYWLRNYLELQKKGRLSSKPSPGLGDMSAAERMKYYVTSCWRIILFSENDIYIALSAALLYGFLPQALWVIAIGVTPWFFIVLVYRTIEIRKLDQADAG